MNDKIKMLRDYEAMEEAALRRSVDGSSQSYPHEGNARPRSISGREPSGSNFSFPETRATAVADFEPFRSLV